MKKFLAIFLTIFSIGIATTDADAKPTKYTFDKEHTTVLFYINHLGFSDKIGLFRDYDGEVVFDKENPEKSFVNVTFRPKGIDTLSKALDEKLQEPAWFNTAKFPEVKYESMKVIKTGADTADVKGWLTMLGVKKRVTLHVKFNKEGLHPYTKESVAGFSIDTDFRRSLFGMKEGIPFVGDEVRIHIESELNAAK